jgi:hypothetical protein
MTVTCFDPRLPWLRPVIGVIVAAGAVCLLGGREISVRLAAQAGPARVASDVVRAPAVPALPPDASATVAIDNVLTRYRLAFNALDARAAKAVWPAVDERRLARAFSQIRMQEVTFADCQVSGPNTSTRAEVTCRGSIRFVPRIGPRTERVELRRWRFVVAQVGDDWRLLSVDTR